MFVSKKTISGHESPLESLDGRLSGNLHGAEPTPRQAGQEPLHFEEPSEALESHNFLIEVRRCADATFVRSKIASGSSIVVFIWP
jgi:hypothetical protein